MTVVDTEFLQTKYFQATFCGNVQVLHSFWKAYILLWMHVCFCCVQFSFSVLSQKIGWEGRLQNDLFGVGWDIKP